jgi:hypothetical protein
MVEREFGRGTFDIVSSFSTAKLLPGLRVMGSHPVNTETGPADNGITDDETRTQANTLVRVMLPKTLVAGGAKAAVEAQFAAQSIRDASFRRAVTNHRNPFLEPSSYSSFAAKSHARLGPIKDESMAETGTEKSSSGANNFQGKGTGNLGESGGEEWVYLKDATTEIRQTPFLLCEDDLCAIWDQVMSSYTLQQLITHTHTLKFTLYSSSLPRTPTPGGYE